MAKTNENETIIVNGVKMTIKEWKASVVEKQKERRGKKRFLDLSKPKKEKKEEKEISIVASEVEKMLKPMTTLKSIQVYKNHAYRSWGTIANEILAYRGIRKPMALYCGCFGELNSLLNDVQNMAKGNEKAAYQYLDKIAWKLDDMKTHINDMMTAVYDSDVCQRFRNHDAIKGTGRQLGLGTIIKKCAKTISQLEDIIGTLQKMADNGTDPFSYGDHMSAKARARCWA